MIRFAVGRDMVKKFIFKDLSMFGGKEMGEGNIEDELGLYCLDLVNCKICRC